MQTLTKKFKHLTQSYIGQLIAILALFAICRVVALSVFYFGFLQTFEKASNIFFETMPVFLNHIPYYSGSILFSSLLHPFFLITLLIFYLPFFIKRKIVKEKLSDYNFQDRVLVFASAFMLSWELSTYDFNYYLNNAFYFDRTLLIILPFVLWRYPLFTPLFIAFACVYRSQFNFPVAGFELFDKRLLFDILVMFVVYLYAKLYLKEFKIPFLFLVICIVASNYFVTGAEKIIMSPHGYEWLFQNNPVDLFTNVHYRGWLAKTDESIIRGILNFLEHYGKYFQTLVMIIELVAILMLRSRKIAIALLVTLALMHVGIFIFGSMLFWKWIVLDVVLAVILLRKNDVTNKELFSSNYFRASVVVILLSPLWLKPLMIGWHDTQLTQFFSYEVEDKNGTVYQFDKNQMNPYHQWFQYDHFIFLVNENCFPVTGFGYSHKYKVAAEIKKTAFEDILNLKQTIGKNIYDQKKKEHYDNFIKLFFKNRNARLNQYFFPSLFSAPHHLYSSVSGNEYVNRLPIARFRVILNQVYTQNDQAISLNKKVVDEILIPLSE